MINFNVAPFLGNELDCIKDAIDSKHISGDGKYTKLCNTLLENASSAPKALLTHSCTAALEIAALLLQVKEGDEIICPSYTFVTTASAFALRGAKLVFVDIRPDTCNMDETKIKAAITEKTKAIVVVHYAGVACAMDTILAIAKKHNLPVIEDAAQAVGSLYKGQTCGSLGAMGCYSFHETKNISSGEGGALLLNKQDYIEQAEIIREKGTNRSKFFRGQVDKYTWVGLGSSYLPSDMIAAYLYPQLQNIEKINSQRIALWNKYFTAFTAFAHEGKIGLPYIPQECTHNAHMFYIRLPHLQARTAFIAHLKQHDIMSVFHYIPLHSSPAGQEYGRVHGDMQVTNTVSDTLVRLPLYYALDADTQEYIIKIASDFLEKSHEFC